MLTDMLNSSSMKQHEVEDFGSFADVFFPLGQPTSRALSLRLQVVEETQKSLVFDVGRLDLQQSLNLF